MCALSSTECTRWLWGSCWPTPMDWQGWCPVSAGTATSRTARCAISRQNPYVPVFETVPSPNLGFLSFRIRMTGWDLPVTPMAPPSLFPSTPTPPAETTGFASIAGVKSGECSFSVSRKPASGVLLTFCASLLGTWSSSVMLSMGSPFLTGGIMATTRLLLVVVTVASSSSTMMNGESTCLRVYVIYEMSCPVSGLLV